MKQFVCPHCSKTVAGEQKFEVKCYHCGKYVYLTDGLTPQDEKKRLLTMASQFAYAYVPKNVREYVDKFGLAQSGPTTLKWFKEHEQAAQTEMQQFLDQVDDDTLRSLHQQYEGDKPFLLYVLDEMKFPIDRAPLDWGTVDTDNCDF